MAGLQLCATRFIFLLVINFILVSSGLANKPVQNVPEPVIQSALNSLNEDSPTHHTYKGGNLISAQKLEETPYVIYRLTFDLTTVCKESLEPCPREACTVEVKQHEQGFINVLRESIQCMYLYPQSTQDDLLQIQENTQEQEINENFDKQIITNQTVELDHEIQNTRDHNEKPFIAVRASSPTYCPGCPYELNPNLPSSSLFGDEVARSMDEFVQNDFKHKAVDIVQLTRAVSPTSNIIKYQVLVRIGESDCLKNAIDESQCSLQANLPIKTCLVTFEQRWQQPTREITRNNCTMDNNSYSTLNSEALVTPTPNREANIEKTEALENLKGILDNYTYTTPVKSEGQQQPEVAERPIVKVLLDRNDDDVHPQGFEDKTREFGEFLKDFDLPIREDKPNPEVQREEVTEDIILPRRVSSANNESPMLNRNKRNRDSIGAPGAPRKKDVNDPEVREMAKKGLQRFSETYEGTNEPIIVEIVEASRQIVSGTLDKIKVKVGPSTCPKGTKDGCQLQAESEIQECLFTLWSQPWLDNGSPKITIDCDLKSDSNINKRNARSAPEINGEVQGSGKSLSAEAVANESRNLRRNRRRSNLVGAPTKKNVDDPEIQNLADKGLQKFSENLEGTNEPIITEIVEASQQVVSGYLYKIKVNLGTSTCAKGVKTNCQLKKGSEIQQCLFTVWSQPWIDKGSPEITINCDVNNRVKRALRGAQYSQKMMKLADDIEAENLFENFLKEHDKIYSSLEEKEKRLAIFKRNLGTIDDLQKFERGTAQYGVTMFADLTREEFKERHLGYRPDLRQENEIPLAMAEIPDIDLPPKFDWREHNAVTPVKNQGQCGSCWAFSVTGNVEGQYAIKHGKLLSLSEQELVDCDTMDQGCGGGEMENAYRTIEKLGGLELEKEYPYDARNEECHFAKNKAKVQVVSAVNITSNETDMAKWLVKNGPISIAINADAMQFYMGGVSHPFRFLCSPKDLDHGVLIVGYGTSTDRLFHRELPYWIVKNSWSPKWGEQGYYRVFRGDGTCGLNATPSSAVVA